MTVYKSKIGAVLVIPLALIMGSTAFALVRDGDLVSLIFMVLVCGFVTHLLLTTWYGIKGSGLVIHSGFLFHREVDIHSIKKIKETYNPLSAPAASLDRLEIFYGAFDSVIISPKDKKGFIAELLRIRPEIEVKYRS